MANDYRTMTTKDVDDEAPKKARPATPQQAGYWWRQEKDKAHSAIATAAKSLRSDQAYRTSDNLRHMRLYGNFDAVGFGLRDATRSASWAQHVNKIALNVIAATTDTLSAKIAKNKPRPFFQTEGGNWGLMQKAKRLDKFCQGVAYELNLPQINQQTFTDSGVLGTGVKKFGVSDEARITCERVLCEELLVDDADGYYGRPRQLFHTKAVPRELAIECWGYPGGKKNPEMLLSLEAARGADAVRMGAQKIGDMIAIHEAWHLPSGEKSSDGRHVICLDSATLRDEPWTLPYFPFTFLRLFPRLVGFWGQGIAERLTGLQLEINRLLKSISEQLRRKGKGRIYVQIGSKVVPSHLTNDIADIVQYTGQPPVVDSGNAVAAEEFAQLDRLVQRAFEEVGISQMNATAQKPAGLDSAPSLREYNDINTERFSLIGQAYEQVAGVEDARIIVDLARQIDEENGSASYKVTVPGKRFIEQLDWKHVNLRNEEFFLKTYPVSSLPTTPAAKREEVQELLAQGFLTDRAEALRLMDMPDLEDFRNLATAALDDVDAAIDDILEERVTRSHGYQAPEKTQNLSLIIQRGTAAYLHAKRDGAPQGALDLLLTYIDQAAAMLDAAKQEEQAKAAAAMPQGPSMLPTPQAAMPGLPPGMGPGPGPMPPQLPLPGMPGTLQ